MQRVKNRRRKYQCFGGGGPSNGAAMSVSVCLMGQRARRTEPLGCATLWLSQTMRRVDWDARLGNLRERVRPVCACWCREPKGDGSKLKKFFAFVLLQSRVPRRESRSRSKTAGRLAQYTVQPDTAAPADAEHARLFGGWRGAVGSWQLAGPAAGDTHKHR